MCGIAGIITQDQSLSLDHVATQMASALSHRGPDDNHYWSHNNLAMIHTRLSIQDLSQNGRQPMRSTSERYMIVYNGEVYNFKRIREKLKEKGYQFNGGSDTEVMLAAIEEYGLQSAVQKFEGMFAFALWDNQEEILHLCRDRLGEKPLYYGWQGKNFVWGSELKAFQKIDCWHGQVNKNILPQYLKYGYVPLPHSIYENHYKLQPGTILSLPLAEIFQTEKFSPFYQTEKAELKPQAYWKLDSFLSESHQNNTLSYNESVEKLDTLLNRVVKDQMISDVPFGAFLSGGIDSSLTTSIMQAQSQSPINTFTIGFQEKDYNEAEFAAKIAKHLGTKHHELYIESQDCLNLVSDLPNIIDEPFADSSVLPAYFVSKMARKEVTVCLSGDAGDELFCGYNRYTYTEKVWNKTRQLPASIRNVAANIILLFPPSLYENIYQLIAKLSGSSNTNSRMGLKIQKLAQLLKKRNTTEIYEMLVSYCQTEDQIFVGDFTPHFLLNSEMLEVMQPNRSFIEQAMAIDTVTYLPDDNLTKVDRTSMASSLETRLPLLNHKVVEFAWTLPLEYKYQNGISKRILRDVLFKRVPRELIERPKMGFSVPIADWLRGPLKSWGESLILDPTSHQHNLLNRDKLNNIWQQHVEGKRDNSAALWSTLMFQAWYLHQH